MAGWPIQAVFWEIRALCGITIPFSVHARYSNHSRTVAGTMPLPTDRKMLVTDVVAAHTMATYARGRLVLGGAMSRPPYRPVGSLATSTVLVRENSNFKTQEKLLHMHVLP